MRPRTSHRFGSTALMFLALLAAGDTRAQAVPEPTPTPTPELPPLPDGQRDFDFLLGKWKFHLKRLENPLTGSTKWIEFDGEGVCRPVWNGNAEIEEVDFHGPTGDIKGLALRLYNPQSHQWSINWANAANGTLDLPTIGSFKNGRGEFYDQETYKGRTILVRYTWTATTTTSPHFEQAYSEDGGKTWEVNWITDQVRVKE
jgi:hypothetical protein